MIYEPKQRRDRKTGKWVLEDCPCHVMVERKIGNKTVTERCGTRTSFRCDLCNRFSCSDHHYGMLRGDLEVVTPIGQDVRNVDVCVTCYERMFPVVEHIVFSYFNGENTVKVEKDIRRAA